MIYLLTKTQGDTGNVRTACIIIIRGYISTGLVMLQCFYSGGWEPSAGWH